VEDDNGPEHDRRLEPDGRIPRVDAQERRHQHQGRQHQRRPQLRTRPYHDRRHEQQDGKDDQS
jgi:hypothetical protein